MNSLLRGTQRITNLINDEYFNQWNVLAYAASINSEEVNESRMQILSSSAQFNINSEKQMRQNPAWLSIYVDSYLFTVIPCSSQVLK